MSKRTVEPFIPHVWADNDTTLSPSAERFNDMEKGILDAHVKPAGRAAAKSVVTTDFAQVVEPGATAEVSYGSADFVNAFDEFGMHPGRTTVSRGGRVYLPVGGIYLIIAWVQSDLGAADVLTRFTAITKNGVQLATSRDRMATPIDLGEQSVYHVGAFAAGDVVGFQISHSGANDRPWNGLSIQWALLSYN